MGGRPARISLLVLCLFPSDLGCQRGLAGFTRSMGGQVWSPRQPVDLGGLRGECQPGPGIVGAPVSGLHP